MTTLQQRLLRRYREMRKQHYMTEQERHQLEAMRRNKIPVREIARQLGFCERTIYYELRRGSYMHTCEFWDEKRYSADKGQQIHRYNQTAKGRPLKIGSDHSFAAYIEHKIIVDRYSPAAALAAARKYPFATRICVSTLYSYIDKRCFISWATDISGRSGKRNPEPWRPRRG